MPFNPTPGTSSNGTNLSNYNEFVGASGQPISSDNPYLQQLQTAVASAPSMYGNGAGIYNAMASGDSANNLQSIFNQAKAWEAQNQGTSVAQRALNTQITNTATQFQSNIPKLEYNLTQQAAEAQKQELATAIQGTKQNFNARGLLNSGLEQGAEASEVGQAAANTTQAAADINQNVNAEGQQLLQGATANQNALTAANQASAANQTQLTGAYNSIAEQNQALSNNALAAVGQGIGGALGTGVGALTNSAQGVTTGAAQTPTSQQIAAYNPMAPSSGLGAASSNYPNLGVLP